MTRLLAAAMLLALTAAPAFACNWNKSVSTDTQSRAVAAQSTDTHATTPPPSTSASKSAHHVPS
ncbi:MAG: hypothetical protein JO264_20315 [Acidisphaera sp.]|nr:hypothetical protein [Acidisphaera sp.]